MSIVAKFLSGIVGGYQVALRPLLPPACRFEPSCSQYYREALRVHGLLRATGLVIRRIGRCHPWHAGGYDPPPPGRSKYRSKSGA